VDHFCLGKNIKVKVCADSSCRLFDIFVYIHSTAFYEYFLFFFLRIIFQKQWHGPVVVVHAQWQLGWCVMLVIQLDSVCSVGAATAAMKCSFE